MRRRRLLQLGLGGALAPALLIGCSDAAPPPGRRLEKFGLQLSTITPLLLADFAGALRQVAALGYAQVEFSAFGFLGRSAQEVQALLEATGLEAPVGRVAPPLPPDLMQQPPERIRQIFGELTSAPRLQQNVAHSLEQALALGQKVMNIPALPPEAFQTLDQVKRSIEALNQAGALCAAQGVQLGYHNHDWEFQAIDGHVPYHLMLEDTAPDLLSFQLDSYWVAKAGRHFSIYFRDFPGRFNSCHLKDISADGDFEDVGHGTLDFPRFVREALAAGAKHFFVERDRPPDPARAIRRSYDYLRQMRF